MKKVELLSPAGDMESLISAIHGGCDAVYIGMKSFGARKFAENFDKAQVVDAIKLCHLYGVKIYVTMNTLVKDNEVSEFMEMVSFLHFNGVDAIIMQDFGMICLVRDTFPNLEIHASTQCNNNYEESINFLKNIGVSRFVLPREMSIDEIKSLDSSFSKEVFIHGALCISYSGLCLMSSLLGGRSGNRGECTGCCRLNYSLYDENKFIKEGCLLSTKELNTSKRIKELVDSGIDSFKIEGRMKSSEYVYFITKYYRNLIDNNINIDGNEEILKVLFNRKFTEGNLFNCCNIMNTSSVNHQGLEVGKVLEVTNDKIKLFIDKKLYQEDGIRFNNSNKGMIVNFLYDKNMKLTDSCSGVCFVDNKIGLTNLDVVSITSSKRLNQYINSYEKRRVPITMRCYAKVNEHLILEVSDGENFISINGDIVDVAKDRPLDKNRIKKQLCKVGNTIYDVCDCEVVSDDNIFIPIGSLNNIRREGLEKLDSYRMANNVSYKKNTINFSKLDIVVTNNNSIDVYNDIQLERFLHGNRIYIHDYDKFVKYKDKNNIYYSVDCNNVDIRAEKEVVSNYLVPNKESVCDYSFNVFNSYTVYYLHKFGYKCVGLSIELSDTEISNLISCFYKNFGFYPNVEVFCYGRVRVMLIKGNVLDISKNKSYYLNCKDKKFPVIYDGKFTSVYSSSLINRIKGINDMQYKINKRYDLKNLTNKEFSEINLIN